MTTEQILSDVELFSKLPPEDLVRIAKLAVRRKFAAGDVIVKEGELGVGFYAIATGRVDVVRAGYKIDSLGPGGFFGEMALFDNQVRAATVQACEDTECVVLTKWDFAAELNRPGSKAAVALLGTLARRVRALDAAATH